MVGLHDTVSCAMAAELINSLPRPEARDMGVAGSSNDCLMSFMRTCSDTRAVRQGVSSEAVSASRAKWGIPFNTVDDL